jgi:omega-6 fatty acid desaturase (delta-12 desaturase)
MDASSYFKLTKDYRIYRASWVDSMVNLVGRVLFTVLGIALSLNDNVFIYIIGQIVYGLAIFQWFAVLHDCGHNCYTPNKKLNELLGYLSSLFNLIPYASWKYIHLEHHIWTGLQDKDPSIEDLNKSNPRKRFLARLAWKSGLPILALAFLLGTFWNLPKQFRWFRDFKRRTEMSLSMALIILFYGLLGQIIPHLWQVILPSYIFFGMFCEPIILSQHAHIPMDSTATHPGAYPAFEQDRFTRSLKFPIWISKWLTMSFENHIAHHLFPWVPFYKLHLIHTHTGNEVRAWDWIKKAKKTPGDVLIFDDRKLTKLDL